MAAGLAAFNSSSCLLMYLQMVKHYSPRAQNSEDKASIIGISVAPADRA
jgi:hypothetical protein